MLELGILFLMSLDVRIEIDEQIMVEVKKKIFAIYPNCLKYVTDHFAHFTV
jgi:hypothetical protein